MRRAILASLLSLAACGGSSSDMPPGGECVAPVNGCSSYVDLRSSTATIAFGGANGAAYVPGCIEVSVGQEVTFQGDFSVHPLSQTCGPVDQIPHTGGGSSLAVTFTTPGTYGFWCDVHHGSGMEGAIEVAP
jgi:plastocyanin